MEADKPLSEKDLHSQPPGAEPKSTLAKHAKIAKNSEWMTEEGNGFNLGELCTLCERHNSFHCPRLGHFPEVAWRHSCLNRFLRTSLPLGTRPQAPASTAQILEKTNVTKGALYYHFRNKRDLGLAVLHDLIRAAVDKTFLEPLRSGENPVDGLVRSITQACDGLSDEEIELGCPLNNLALEMSPTDEAFRHVIGDIYAQWRGEIAQALKRGQVTELVRRDVDPDETAAFIVAALAGCRSMAKNSQSRDMLLACARQLCRYLETLKVQSKS